MRDVSTVIDCMVVHIPKEEANFINALMKVVSLPLQNLCQNDI